MQKPSTIDIDPVISLAIELSASTWLAASKIAASEKTGLHRMEAGNCQALLALIADPQKKVAVKLGVEAAVVSCFEAGRDGFWLHRLRSEPGARETIDGHLRDGAEVLMIDDVATTGGSILKAIEGMEGHGCYVRRALAVVDREEGAAQNLAAQCIQLAAIFKRSDFPEI